MPNFNVFNRDVDNLRVKIFGSDNNTPIQVDGSGNLIVGAGTVTITGGTISALSAGTVTISGGTINTVAALNAGTVTITGGTISALSAGTVTISGGTINTVRTFTEASQTVSSATTDFTGGAARDVSDKVTYSIFVHNTTANDANVRLEISPDNTTWLVDGTAVSLAASAASALVPAKFLKYLRVAYAAAVGGSTVTINTIYQAQS